MSAHAILLGLYREWRALTGAEREAIEANDWRRVKICQTAKSDLQPKILRETQEAQKEWARNRQDRAALEKELRSLINELIYLETRNGEFIAQQRASAEEEFLTLERSGRNLHNIQRRYVPETGRTAIAWESYS